MKPKILIWAHKAEILHSRLQLRELGWALIICLVGCLAEPWIKRNARLRCPPALVSKPFHGESSKEWLPPASMSSRWATAAHPPPHPCISRTSRNQDLLSQWPSTYLVLESEKLKRIYRRWSSWRLHCFFIPLRWASRTQGCKRNIKWSLLHHHNHQKLFAYKHALQEFRVEMVQVGVDKGDTDEPLFTFWLFILEKWIIPL